MIPLEQVLKKIKSEIGITGSLFLFVIFRNVNNGYLGVSEILVLKLPKVLYSNYITTYMGFPTDSFFSTDYFSLLPWLFLFITGYYVYGYLKHKESLESFLNVNTRIPFVGKMGRKSLLIYMCHQPVVYGILMMGNKLLR